MLSASFCIFLLNVLTSSDRHRLPAMCHSFNGSNTSWSVAWQRRMQSLLIPTCVHLNQPYHDLYSFNFICESCSCNIVIYYVTFCHNDRILEMPQRCREVFVPSKWIAKSTSLQWFKEFRRAQSVGYSSADSCPMGCKGFIGKPVLDNQWNQWITTVLVVNDRPHGLVIYFFYIIINIMYIYIYILFYIRNIVGDSW